MCTRDTERERAETIFLFHPSVGSYSLFFMTLYSYIKAYKLLLLLQDGSLLAATINGFPLSTAKITEKRKIIEEIALADVKKVRRLFTPRFWRTFFLVSCISLELYFGVTLTAHCGHFCSRTLVDLWNPPNYCRSLWNIWGFWQLVFAQDVMFEEAFLLLLLGQDRNKGFEGKASWFHRRKVQRNRVLRRKW